MTRHATRTSFSVELSSANETASVTAVDNHGVDGVLMAFGAVCLASINGRRAFASQEILSKSDGFEVFRVHAVTDSTKVIKCHAFRYWANEKRVDDTVSFTCFALPTNAPVSDLANGCGPYPASTLSYGDLLLDTGRKFTSIHVNKITTRGET